MKWREWFALLHKNRNEKNTNSSFDIAQANGSIIASRLKCIRPTLITALSSSDFQSEAVFPLICISEDMITTSSRLVY